MTIEQRAHDLTLTLLDYYLSRPEAFAREFKEVIGEVSPSGPISFDIMKYYLAFYKEILQNLKNHLDELA